MDTIEIAFADRSFKMSAVGGADHVAIEIASGAYEAPLPILVMAFSQRLGGHFIDVGANNGLYTLLATSAREDIRAIAFEPYPPAADVFHMNMALNGLSARVVLHQRALSDSACESLLYIPTEEHGLLETSCSLEHSFKGDSQRTLTVEKQRLDDVQLPIGPLVMKVDIEGHEASFFRGAYGTIARTRPIIFAELLTLSSGEFYSVSRNMRELGYSFFQLRPDLLRKVDLISYHRLTLNYLLLPNERFHQLADVCQVHGLELTCDLLI